MEAPSGVIYRVASIPLCEYEITYLSTPPPLKKRRLCCMAWLFCNSMGVCYKTRGNRNYQA
jgi:hypothetical protein